ncbi:MAG TPA: protease pro-enzyme activation domain-containing protein [Thermoplasmata archaeon]|nr:protease pro-enzyme activation domain-containing protein [Thermoplasmata archaeon]
MRLPTLASVLLVTVILVLVTPVGTLGHPAARAPSPTLPTFTTDALPLPARASTALLAPTSSVGITLTLPYSNSDRLSSLLTAVEDPASPEYRHFLTAPEFRSEFAPSPSTVEAVSEVLLGHGASELSVGPNQATVSALLPAGEVESLFGVELRVFAEHDGAPIYTAVGTASLPPALVGRVLGIGGLTNAANPALNLEMTKFLPRPESVRAPTAFVDSNTSQQWFVGSDYTQAYGASELLPGGSVGAKATYPTHIAIATLLFSSWNQSSNANLPPWDPNVVYTYFNNTTAPGWPAPHLVGVPVTINGVTAPPPGSLGAANDTTGAEFENSLDLEMAEDLAPGASIYNFYIPGSSVQNGALADIADELASALSAALNYPYTGVTLGVVSGSFGLPDLNDTAWNSALEQAAATGVTVAIASGDQGDAPDSDTGRSAGPWPTWPATAAFETSGVLSVGGVSITIHGVPTATYNGAELNVTYDSNETGISSMAAWWNNVGPPGGWAGTEGGLSTVIPEPNWQFHSAAQPAIANAGNTEGTGFLGRAGPDLAFPANATLAYVVADAQGNLYFDVLAGTSVASPVFAGILADEIADSNHSFGYLDPELYRMGGYYASTSVPSDPFLDVTVGHNFVFSAGPGWDATTGWGGLAAPLLLTALANSTVDNYTYTGPTPGLSAPAPGAQFPWVAVVLIVVLGVASAVALAVAFGRPRHPVPSYPPSAAWGPPAGFSVPATGPRDLYGVPPAAGPPLAAATFLCPYCGAPRPSEPVRCPRCGAL